MKTKDFVLVTGGTGFIGFALVKRLILSGFSVRVITRGNNFHREFEDLRQKTPESLLEVYIGDISTKYRIKQAFENVSYVYHVAALANIHEFLPRRAFETANVDATRNICELCLENHIKKLFYISTCDVFGLPFKNHVISEESPFRQWSEPYADTKIKATQIVKKFEQSGLIYTILYPGWVYGPGDRTFLPSLVEQMKSGIMPVWESDANQLCLVYIDDFIHAIILAMENENTNNNDFLILDDKSGVSLLVLCERLGESMNLKFKVVRIPYNIAYVVAWLSEMLCRLKISKTPFLTTSDVKALGKTFVYSSDKAKRTLGWSAKKDFRTGLLEWKRWHEMQISRS